MSTAASDDETITSDPNRQEDLARQLGLEGEPAPAWIKGNVRNFAAYKRGLDERGGPPAPSSSSSRRTSRAARRLASSGRRAAPRDGYLSRAFSPSSAGGRLGIPAAARGVASAGDGGGLLLALVLYPLALATAKYGAAGPGAWFRAKWLNQATAAPAAPPRSTAPPGRIGGPSADGGH